MFNIYSTRNRDGKINKAKTRKLAMLTSSKVSHLMMQIQLSNCYDTTINLWLLNLKKKNELRNPIKIPYCRKLYASLERFMLGFPMVLSENFGE